MKDNPDGLKPCPFCGATAPLVSVDHREETEELTSDMARAGFEPRHAEWYVVSCGKCFIETSWGHSLPVLAAEEWNRRTHMKSVVGWLIKRHRREMDRLRAELSRERQAHMETRRSRP